MTPHIDILEQRDSLRAPWFASLALHASVMTVLLVGNQISSDTARFGDPNPGGGGSISVNAVRAVPMPGRTGLANPVANDTQSRVPQPPAKAKPTERAQPDDREAIALKYQREKRRASEIAAGNQRFRANPDEQPNQLYSRAGQALASPMVAAAGSGGVGVGSGGPLGERFGAYAKLLQQLVAQRWNTNDVDPRLRTAPAVVVTFAIQRDGALRDIKVAQSSGNPVLDLSAQRAVYDVGKVQPLPPGFERDEARVEFVFELRR
ncbi:MAG: TonB family protein [Candidatus Solibacter usitatus]|nr:TonB family protein [Candidatus Solibacter usitatus]